MSKYVPFATRKRLPIYYRMFKTLKTREYQTITSNELEKILKIDARTIRRDFSYIGRLGRQGYGYQVEEMISIFEDEFELNVIEPVILLGFGHLGYAIASYCSKMNNISVLAQIYEVDKKLIGTKKYGIEILDYHNIEKSVDKNVHMAIIAVMPQLAQEIFEKLVLLGFNGFINFSGGEIFNDRDDIIVYDIDIMQVLQSLIYDLRAEY
ncbi:MAG: redox-sensing transcriptional repressor Rex [Bacilli bacterium]|jgi:redox-sensing transcriptional repressor|nr:redox-sensing transcriptional repressor Rex [Bacilli bacterium]